MQFIHLRDPARLPARLGILFLSLVALPAALAAQDQEYEAPATVTLNVTSASPAALQSFQAGMWEWDNIDFGAAAGHFEEALAIDPSFGAARVMHAGAAPGMTADERVEQIAVGMIDMARGTTVEQLLALALKESISGSNATAAMLVKAASELAPGSPHLAYRAAIWSGGDVKALKAVTKQFPDFAPAWNTIAYNLYDDGKTDEAVKAVTKYLELAPDHPNAHDSYAEIMQWEGQTETALAHYRKAVELRPSYEAGYTGIAETEWLLGNRDEARGALEQAAMHQTSENARINTSRAIAASYMMEGDRKKAEAMFSDVASAAVVAGSNGLARTAHYQAAQNDAINGNGKSVAAHIQQAAELGGEGTIGHYFWGSVAYSLAGDIEASRAMLASLEEVAAESAPAAIRRASVYLLLADEDAEGAMVLLEEEEDGTAMFVRALKARCYKAMKQGDMAKELQASVLTDPGLSFTNAGETLAVTQVRKL
jgi:tetratricopeptide (TPR) repeat protein